VIAELPRADVGESTVTSGKVSLAIKHIYVARPVFAKNG
jgi:hypothetical protein